MFTMNLYISPIFLETICKEHFWKVDLAAEGCLCFLICCISNVKKEMSSENFQWISIALGLKLVSVSFKTFDDY